MRWFRSLVDGAGLNRFGHNQVLVAISAVAGSVGWAAGFSLKIPVLGFFVGLGAFALQLEMISGFSKKRRRDLAKLWPEVLDSIHSALSAGLSLIDAFDDLALRGPLRLRAKFEILSKRLDSGWTLEAGLMALKDELGEVHADRLCEVLFLVSATGSESLLLTLRRQSIGLRRDISQSAQIESKQSWVLGTAKIAVAAPWVVVALLASRAENASVFNTTSGALVLMLGFVMSAFAYRLVHALGALPESPRVFAA